MICRKNIFVLIACISAFLHYGESRPSSSFGEPKCGYESCPKTKPNMLNVHLVAHTHDDVGWLKTVDQYYYGSQTKIQQAGVQYIIDSVVQELLRDPAKRFIYVESAFFSMWWQEQTPEMQDQVKMLVNEGRLEFIGGAWSMNDEGTTHYQGIVDQFSWGLRFLNDTFGECARPRVGWQIDPFGHSREMASIFAQMGFDGLFLARLDYQDKEERFKNKKGEMIWHASANLGQSSHIFTSALYNEYAPPAGFCFDTLCTDEPIIDGKQSPDNNVKRRVDEFLSVATNMSLAYRTNNILLTMGEDFHYQNANSWYKNLDKLIKYANERQKDGSNIHLLYSTPSCYLKSLHDAGITWPTKDDDFFPYASDPHAFWTGYFTSRPTLKRYERMGNHFLQVCKQLTALVPKESDDFLPHLSFMRETMGIMQHHDAVTGTEKEKVASDYAQRIDVGLKYCSSNAQAILNHLTTGEEPKPVDDEMKENTEEEAHQHSKLQFQSCTLLNISMCEITENNEKFIVTLYNPLGHSTDEYVRIPVSDLDYEVADYKDNLLETQFIPIPEDVQKITFRDSPAKYELIFLASELPPFGYKSYYVKKSDQRGMPPVPETDAILKSIGNENLRLMFDTNGFLTAVTTEGMTRTLNQEFLYYEGVIGDNRETKNRSSGAYIFRPKEDLVRTVSTAPELKFYRGNLVEEVHQKFNDWISQVIRVYRKQNYAEFEWLVGPIPIEDGVGKEIITRFNSDIKSGGTFYTDSNGREILKRMRDHRDTWNVKLYESTAGNYYPVNTKIALEDENARLAILTDRAQGGASMAEGSLEIMVHRRLLHDDAKGVGEALNETVFGQGLIARGVHYFVLGSSQKDKSPTKHALERFVQLEKLLPTWKFFSDATDIRYDDWRSNYTNIFSGISATLPKNIHLMTFEPWHTNEILVRFEHIFEKDEDPEYSKTVQFNLKELLHGFPIVDLRETTLDGSAWLAEKHRMEFVHDPKEPKHESYAIYEKSAKLETKHSDELLPTDGLAAESQCVKPEQTLEMGLNLNDTKFIVELSPMQMRTFVLYLASDRDE